MKRRFADGRNNEDILKKEFSNLEVNEDFFKGNIAVLKIIEAKKEWRVDEEQRCILADNYTWLEIYPKDKHYCITAMLDDKDNIKEWYIDVARKLGIEEGVPYEDDLYLDVVIVPDGRVHLLDEDELVQAYEQKNISKEEFDLAYKTANNLMRNMPEKIEQLTKFTNYCFRKSKDKSELER